MLEVIQIQIPGGQGRIGRGPVGELNHLDLQALFLGLLGCHGNRIGQRAGRDADFQCSSRHMAR